MNKLKSQNDLALHSAIREGDLQTVLVLLRSGIEVDRADPEGLTPLMVSSGLGEFHLTQLLLTAGANVHAIEPRMGAAALHKAVQSGNSDLTGLLLDHGAFIDQQTPILGNTPLIDAVLYKHSAVVRLLLQRGARPTIANHWGQTPIDIAQMDGLAEISGYLEEKRSENENKLESLKLVAAVRSGNTGEVERLISAGYPLDEQVPTIGSADDHYTPLGIAAKEGHADIASALLKAGADQRRIIGLMGGMAIHDATYFGHTAIVEMLTEKDEGAAEPAGINLQGAYNGYTALHDAVWHGHFDIARALMAAGAKLTVRAHNGQTPMIWQ
ncbi:ankyrin repeat domain-containing protein [Pedobacter sp. G11]|uniref:ankyrin repeat domain-containing protein n=1 Tax=Pedobacter sp. G11 TaxID=2482728 RepID=UPI001AEF407C|nr:ankyrin repeat domain-containing protein [Pedobacter sp. G11]